MSVNLTPTLFLIVAVNHVVCLTESDGYNIGVILGSVVAGLLVIAVAAFIVYTCCIKTWQSPKEPRAASYKIKSDTKKKPRPLTSHKGGYIFPEEYIKPMEYRAPISDTVKGPARLDDRSGLVSIFGARAVQPSSMQYSPDSAGRTPAPIVALTNTDSGQSQFTGLQEQLQGSAYEAARMAATASAAKTSPTRLSAAYLGTGV